jgi:class II lanthipeptide synthase
MAPDVSYFRDPRWCKALTLSERIERLRGNRGATPEDVVNAALAQKHLERWRALPPFADEKLFAQHLEAYGLTEKEFFHVLGTPADYFCSREPTSPTWLDKLEQAFAPSSPSPAQEAPDDAPPASADEERKPAQLEGFFKGLSPLIQQTNRRFFEEARALEQAHGEFPIDMEQSFPHMLQSLFSQLMTKAMRTLVLELHVARLQGQLEGETPEERFRSFSERLSRPEVLLPLLQEYPVLARQLITSLEFWAQNYLELITRLCKDFEQIKQTFNGRENPGRLVHLSGGVGDAHCEGRSVLILTFDSGFKLVYKPHSLSVDVHFAHLLEWLNERGTHPAFRTVRALDREAYGWVEFVEAKGCETEDEVRRFYRRQGGLLSLLYSLEATDFHLENLIASGEHPVLVDLESLFHPRVSRSTTPYQSLTAATNAMNYSVLRIGMLPQRIWSPDNDGGGVDLSGLGGAPGQLTPFPVLTFDNAATDEMRVIRKRLEMPGSQNRPHLTDREIDLQDYTHEVIAGFTTVYKLLLEQREELIADDGPLARFAADPVRAVLRATKTYGELLAESHHPDLQRDALGRDRLFDRLWSVVKNSPEMARVIPSEIADLQRGDIPFFSCRPQSHDLWNSRGERLPDFFEETSLDVVRRRLQELSEADLSRQVWFISASISSLTLGLDESSFVGSKLAPSRTSAGRERLLVTAATIGDRLEELAIRDENNVNWVGLSFVGERNWTLFPLSDELYDGTLGVALFLAQLGEVTQTPKYTELARTVAEGVAKRIAAVMQSDERNALASPPGGYNGLGSIVHTLAHVGSLWNAPELLDAAESVVELLPPLIEKDETLDVISGSAGCIANLLSLYHSTSSERALQVAAQCADRILELAQPAGNGIAWNTTLKAFQPLTGLSHGVAGIAWALFEVWGVTGDERYKSAALKAFEYERSVFSVEEENWPDYRDLESGGVVKPEGQFMTTWCHGAPGIGLARLRVLALIDDPEIRREIEAAVRTTLRHGFGLNHSLCHGDLGNLEFLLEAGRVLGDRELLRRVEQFTAAILDSIDQYGLLCGTPKAIETPGLMTGIAGIGYELLRLAAPEQVPSILTLAAPLRSSRRQPALAMAGVVSAD